MPPPLVRIASRFPGGDFDAAQRLGAVEQLAQIGDPQDAGAAERRIVDRVRAGQRAGMGRSGFRALRHAAGFDDDDGLDPRSGARRRHEFPGVLDRFDIEQDRTRLAVQREVIEQIGDIDVELVADRHDPGKTHRRAAPPNPPCPRRSRRTARSAPDFPRHGICAAKLALRFAPGIMMPRQFGPISRIPYFCAARSAASANEPGPWPSPAVTMSAPAHAATPGLIDEASDRSRRRRNHHEFGHERQFGEAADRSNAVDLGIARIHQTEFALEFRLAEYSREWPGRPTLAADWRRPARPNGAQADFSDDRLTSVSNPASAGPL